MIRTMETEMTPDEQVVADVRDVGWHVIGIAEDEEGPAYAFTIGLASNFAHPELIIFGLPLDIMHSVLNMAGNAIKGGRSFKAGIATDELIEDYACTFVAFPHSA